MKKDEIRKILQQDIENFRSKALYYDAASVRGGKICR